MAEVFSPNIFLSTDKQAMLDFFYGGDTLRPRIPDKYDNKKILLLTQNNKYLKSFEYQIGYDKKNNGVSLNLEFIDIDGRFEHSFYSQDVVSQFILKAIKEHNISKVQDPYASTPIENKLKTAYTLYFAFGIGDNFKEWGGPYAAVLQSTRVDITSNGSRVYKFTFVPTGSYLFRPAAFFDINQQEEVLDLETYSINYLTTGKATIGFNSTRDINYCQSFRAVLENYIKSVLKIDKKQVLVLVPDVNDAIKSKIVDPAFKNYSSPIRDPLGVGQDINANIKKMYLAHGINAEFSPLQDKGNPLLKKGKNLITKTSRLVNMAAVGMSDFRQETLFPASKLKSPIGNINHVDELVTNKDYYLLTMQCGSFDTIKKGNSFPRWYEPLRQFNEGIRQFIPGKFMLFEENNIRLLRLWKDLGLIEDSESPCIVFGHSEALQDYVYCNKLNFETIDEIPSKYKLLSDQDSIFGKNYRLNLLKNIALTKSSSSFNEDTKEFLDQDEFSVGLNDDGKTNSNTEIKSRIRNSVFKKVLTIANLGIPIFTNNIKNQNVLGISIDNSTSYQAALNSTIASNREKFFNSISLLEMGNTLSSLIGKNKNDTKSTIDILNLNVQEKARELEAKNKDILSRIEDPTQVSSVSRELTEDTNNQLQILNNSLKDKYKDLLDGSGGFGFTDTPSGTKAKELVDIQTDNLLTVSIMNTILAEGITLPYQSLQSLSKFLLLYNKLGDNGINEIGTRIIPGYNGPDSISLSNEIFKQLYQYNIIASVKTLPFFHLSNNLSFMKNILLLSKKIKVLNSNYSHEDESKYDDKFDFFTGFYKLTSFKHIINPTDCYSEFTIIKDVPTHEEIGLINNPNPTELVIKNIQPKLPTPQVKSNSTISNERKH